MTRKLGGYDNSTPNVQIKVAPENVSRLRDLLAQPQNIDLYEAGIKGKDFAECLAEIAASLDIAIDGWLNTADDVNNFCGTLCEAVQNRKLPGMKQSPHKQAGGLMDVELVERTDGTVTLEEVGEAIGSTGASERGTGPYTICDNCKDSFVCCISRSCRNGTPVQQLENTIAVLKQHGIIH